MPRESQYKPLLFTTTVRTPERLKAFLGVLLAYDGHVLDDRLAKKVAGDLIRKGVYRPRAISASAREKLKSGKQLTHAEVAKILRDNPQNHKEAGFQRGWPSRFDTWFKLAKELGFVFYRAGGSIRFSEIGKNLADAGRPEFEQEAFLNAFVKYQRNNPFRRARNENVPLLLLLATIEKLNAGSDGNTAGISKLELPLLIYWKDGDAESLARRIKSLRQRFGFTPSWESVLDICRNEIMGGADIIRSDKSIMVDYPDEYIRKMRLTGLITLRGGGRFVDINRNEMDKVNYVLKNYSAYKKHGTEEAYFDHISAIDKNLFSLAPKQISAAGKSALLAKWVDRYAWGVIKKEMGLLSSRQSSKDETLKYLPHPVRLEFLTALAIKSRFPQVEVVPNYPVDDEGIPTSTAAGAGNTGDIECFENRNGILVEVTMSGGVAQTTMEAWPIARHLHEFQKKAENAMCFFVAPSVFIDSQRCFRFLKKEENLSILPKTIGEFLEHLEHSAVLFVRM